MQVQPGRYADAGLSVSTAGAEKNRTNGPAALSGTPVRQPRHPPEITPDTAL